jgi:hypothetical protein
MPHFDELVQKLRQHPDLRCQQSENELTIDCPNDGGFSISIRRNSDEYMVYFGNWHGHFDTLEEAVAFVNFGLSDCCHVREFRRGDVPYWWVIERRVEGKWLRVQTTGVLVFPFWRKKKEVILQNRVFNRDCTAAEDISDKN